MVCEINKRIVVIGLVHACLSESLSSVKTDSPICEAKLVQQGRFRALYQVCARQGEIWWGVAFLGMMWVGLRGCLQVHAFPRGHSACHVVSFAFVDVCLCVYMQACVVSMGTSDLKQVSLVDELPLALLQLGSQPPELALILAQQGALVHILIHPGCVANVFGPIGKLQGAQGLCKAHQKRLQNH